MQAIDSLFDIDDFHAKQRRYRHLLNLGADKLYDGSLSYKERDALYKDYQSLDTVVRNWEKVARQIPSEMVQCRRKRSPTQRLNELLRKYREYHDELESLLVMYSLIYT